MATWKSRSAAQESSMAVTGEMSITERLQYLLDTGQFADVNIRVGQGPNVHVFKAHRLLLATASQPLFKLVYAMNPNPGPSDITTIRINDMKPKDFEPILKYIYTDNIDYKDIKIAFEMLRASKKWGLAGLGIKSLTFLERFIDDYEPSDEDMKTNLFDLLVLSEQTLGEMCDKCWTIITKYANDVIPCEGFLRLERDMIRKVMLRKDLKFDDQLKVFEAIRDWGLRYVKEKNLKMTQLGDVVEDLLKVVDFDKINDKDFVNTVLTSECLGKAEVIAFFMTHGLELPKNLDFNNNKQITSLTQNGTVSEFNKVCRFRKGYRCPIKEIYQEHELRFRVDKNVLLLGVSFGFLFSCTDMGVTIHCQGPWETRQWTDIERTYCRVSGETQEAADVRLMFTTPVRIAADQSYKILVKIGRMSSGSSDVELWGGTGGQHCIETEDAEFFFIKAAVDSNKSVEESEGDVKPGVITELLYKVDTGEDEPPKRRRPQPADEDTLKVPEVPQARKRSPPGEDRPLDAPPVTRRREGRRTSGEEYKPESFSSNRWRTRTRGEDTDTRNGTNSSTGKAAVEEYKPSSFSTNRWRIKKTEDSTDTTKTDDTTNRKTSTEEYKPDTYATNRYRSRRKEDEPTTPDTTVTTANRWRPKPVEPAAPSDTVFGNRKYSGTSTVEKPSFMRRRESTESKASDVPFFLRKPSNEEPRTTTTTGRSRFGTSSTSTTPSTTSYDRSSRDSTTSYDRPSRDSTTRTSRYSRDNDTTPSYRRPSDTPSLRSRDLSTPRYSTTTRDSSLSRVPSTRDSSLSRLGSTSSRLGSSYGSSGGSSYGSSGYSSYSSRFR